MNQYKKILLNNGSYKLVALIIALILWLAVLRSSESVITHPVTLKVSTPKDVIILNELPKKVIFRISGSKVILKKYFSKESEPIVLDLNNSNLGRQFVRIPESSLALPYGAKLVNITPSTVFVETDKLIEKKVPVKVSLEKLSELDGLKVKKVEPPEISLQGARNQIRSINVIWTQTVKSNDIKNHPSFLSEGIIEMDVPIRDINEVGVYPITVKNVKVSFAVGKSGGKK